MTSFHVGLAPLVTFDGRGGEAHAFQLDHYECDLARNRCEPTLAAPGAVRRSLVGALVGRSAHQLIGFLEGFPD